MQQTAESVWKKCLSFVEDNIDPQAFKTWFNPIIPIKLKDNALNIEVPVNSSTNGLKSTTSKYSKLLFTKNLDMMVA